MKHYSFDFDYTLADSSQGAVECANYAFRALGLPQASPERITETIGLSLDRTFQELTERNSDPEQLERFKELFLKRAETAVLKHIRFYNYTSQTLKRIKGNGFFISVVSTKHRARIVQSLERDELLSLIDLVVGGDEVSQNKPHPEGLLRAIEVSGIERRHTVYVGDSQTDGECAQRAGVDFVAVKSGKTSMEKLERWNPKCVMNDLSELC